MKDLTDSRDRRDEAKLAVPSVHLNGTGKDSLLEGYGKALHALRQASDALAAIHPHPRDYYVQRDPHAFQKADDEHRARRNAVERIINDLEEVAMAVHDQEKRG